MAVHHINDRLALDPRSPAHHAMVTSGLWLRLGFVALSVEAMVLIRLATGEASPWIAIAFAVVAGVTARWSWSKARAALDAEAAETNAYDIAAPKPRTGGLDARVEPATSR
ncbi:MAG TPA: hypothetical protein VMU96_01300 [Casimicrobiaceae bacterium]|nr:hypothetical protein [Casimicrobiaceae bacterium]